MRGIYVDPVPGAFSKATWLSGASRLMPLVFAALLLAAIVACSSGARVRALYIGGIPDQDVSLLKARFDALADYLSAETGITVKYQPSVYYAAVVTAFKRGDIQMAWFGGLTGVQARLAVPEAEAIAQRPQDERFESVFVTRADSDVRSLNDLRGRTFTFGSESSTSGNLMPRHFLVQAGIDPERDFLALSYSGSHDKSWKLVEAGTFEAAVLNADVWRQRVEEGAVDTSRVRVFYTTPPYYDYHWVIRGDVDQEFGGGTADKIKTALLALSSHNGGQESEIMEAFRSDGFIPTENRNYEAIEDVARRLGIIQE